MSLAKTPALDDEVTPVAAAGPEVPDEVASSELLGRIDRGLPPDVRADFLRMRAGLQLPTDRRDAVREAVLAIAAGDLGDVQPVEPPPAGRLTDDEVRRVLSMRESGRTVKDIAAESGCSPGQVEKIIYGYIRNEVSGLPHRPRRKAG
jgi:hypothetical protein